VEPECCHDCGKVLTSNEHVFCDTCLDDYDEQEDIDEGIQDED
jgi:hypothetical protein